MSQEQSLLRQRRPGPVARVLYGLLLVALPPLGVLIVSDTVHFARNHQSARAEVLHVETECHGGHPQPCVVNTTVRFVISSGRTIEATLNDPYLPGRVGDFFTIYYDPGDPRDARTIPSWPIGWVLFIVVIIFSWIGAVSALFRGYR